MIMGSHQVGRGAAEPLDARNGDRVFTGVGGTLPLTPEGDLYGAGWALSIPYRERLFLDKAKG